MIVLKGNLILAETWCSQISPEENAANARLIAAAPELYAALEAALPHIYRDQTAVIAQIEAALRKARGEE